MGLAEFMTSKSDGNLQITLTYICFLGEPATILFFYKLVGIQSAGLSWNSLIPCNEDDH